MDIMQVWKAYQRDADPETIFPMYQECELNEKAEGYGDVNLLHIASQNAHPEAVAWLLEQGARCAGILTGCSAITMLRRRATRSFCVHWQSGV